MASAPTDANPPPPRHYACVLCQQRKVKCDRQSPCSGCQKYDVHCLYRPPPPPRRRKRRSPEDVLLTRLRKYEDLLTGLGVDVRKIDEQATDNHFANEETVLRASSSSATAVPIVRSCSGDLDQGADPDGDEDELQSRFGRMIIGDGKSQFLENSLWLNLSGEIGDPDMILENPGGTDNHAEFLLSTGDSPRSDGSHLTSSERLGSVNLRALHPDTVQIFKLWQIYVDNMDPVTKICHKPTVQQQILDSSSDLDNIPRAIEALMFGIYSCAVASLHDEDCIIKLGETRDALLHRFHTGARHALVRAEFLTSSDLTVFRAFLLYLLSLRGHLDTQTLWVLGGVAMRIAQRLGLHRDGARFGLPVFEVEMRRRLWWPTLYFDGLNAELCGMGGSVVYSSWDTKLPLNVNDSDITPDMREPPIEQKGLTEMGLCLVRYEVGVLLRNIASKRSFDGPWGAISDEAVMLSDRLNKIADLEKLLENKYLQYCDKSIPLHLLTWMVGRSCIVMLRFRARAFPNAPSRYHPVRHPPEVLDALFADTLQITHNYYTFCVAPGIKRYNWHVSAHFQWHAFIFMLHELQRRTLGEQVDTAWTEVGNVFSTKPELLSDTKPALHIAIGNLTLKAWEARKAALIRMTGRTDQESIAVPPFVEILQLRHIKPSHHQPISLLRHETAPSINDIQHANHPVPDDILGTSYSLFPPNDTAIAYDDFGLMPETANSHVPAYELSHNSVDWSQWDILLQGTAAADSSIEK